MVSKNGIMSVEWPKKSFKRGYFGRQQGSPRAGRRKERRARKVDFARPKAPLGDSEWTKRRRREAEGGHERVDERKTSVFLSPVAPRLSALALVRRAGCGRSVDRQLWSLGVPPASSLFRALLLGFYYVVRMLFVVSACPPAILPSRNPDGRSFGGLISQQGGGPLFGPPNLFLSAQEVSFSRRELHVSAPASPLAAR